MVSLNQKLFCKHALHSHDVLNTVHSSYISTMGRGGLSTIKKKEKKLFLYNCYSSGTSSSNITTRNAGTLESEQPRNGFISGCQVRAVDIYVH